MATTFISAADGNDVPSAQYIFQAQYIPKQKAHPALDDPSMFAYISTYPALGQVTQIEKHTKFFTALLEVDESRASQPWQLLLLHSAGEEWQEVPMEPILKASAIPSDLQTSSIAPGSGRVKLYFTTPLAIHLPTKFTIKFRSGPKESWKCVKDHQGTTDGVIMLSTVTSQDAISSDLGDYITGLNPILKSKNHRSESPGTTIWSVEAPVEAAVGEKSIIKDVKFGLPWGVGKFSRWFALIRIWSPWLAPRQGTSVFGLDKDAVMCSFLSVTGKHLVLLAITGVEDVMTLFTSDIDGNVVLRIRNDSAESRVSRVIVGLGDDFESANAAVMYHARGIVTTAQAVSDEQQKEIDALNEEDEQTKVWAENWYDGLTYCTWNALGQRLTEEKVMKAVTTLAENKINITNFIIDDNWQSIDYRGNGQFQYGMIEFEAEKESFPKGLKHTVDLIRAKHPSIQHIAVWHAILGYWGGLSPDGKIAKTYKTANVVREESHIRNLPLGGPMTVVAKEDVAKFYDDFYSFLSSCGVDAVKTDAQFTLDTFISAVSRRDLIPAYLDAWNISTLRHFGVKAISCMSQTPQILFHSQMPTNRPPILVRNSADFFPEIPTSHPWHIFVNAHNALFTQHLNIIPDWDMFQTVHEYSGFHAAARCVSGGPIYITDIPGEHDLDLIYQMTGTTPRGKTVIFRPSVVGKSLDQYNGYDDEHLLFVGTYHGSANTGTGIIGIFNISQRPLTELLSLSKFPGVVPGQSYIIRAHTSGLVSAPMQVVDANSLVSISLGVRGYEIMSAYPLREFESQKGKEKTLIANLGLLGKMAGAVAVVGNKIEMVEGGRVVVDTNLKALGVLGIYLSTLPSICYKDSTLITIQGQVIPVHTVSISKVDKHVLEIDVETAWKEMGLKAGWSNEVEVKIYVNSV